MLSCGSRGSAHALLFSAHFLIVRQKREMICKAATKICSNVLRLSCPGSEVSGTNPEVQPQILRLTTPRLKNVWGPVRSG
jgi:hypothetical protein